MKIFSEQNFFLNIFRVFNESLLFYNRRIASIYSLINTKCLNMVSMHFINELLYLTFIIRRSQSSITIKHVCEVYNYYRSNNTKLRLALLVKSFVLINFPESLIYYTFILHTVAAILFAIKICLVQGWCTFSPSGSKNMYNPFFLTTPVKYTNIQMSLSISNSSINRHQKKYVAKFKIVDRFR